MTTKYSITIKNQKEKPVSFLLFVEKPEVSSEAGQAFTNVYAKAPGVPFGGTGTFEIYGTDYAVCGNTIGDISKGTVVKTGHSQNVALGPSQLGLTELQVNSQGGVQLTTPTITETSGGFEIGCGNWDPEEFPHIYCGYGKLSQGKVLPVSVWRAEPNETFKVYPKLMFYIGTGDYTVGEVVDVATLGKIVLVDFTGRKQRFATTEFLKTNTYSEVEYQFSGAALEVTHLEAKLIALEHQVAALAPPK